jgi:hypothetical protein
MRDLNVSQICIIDSDKKWIRSLLSAIFVLDVPDPNAEKVGVKIVFANGVT